MNFSVKKYKAYSMMKNPLKIIPDLVSLKVSFTDQSNKNRQKTVLTEF